MNSGKHITPMFFDPPFNSLFVPLIVAHGLGD